MEILINILKFFFNVPIVQTKGMLGNGEGVSQTFEVCSMHQFSNALIFSCNLQTINTKMKGLTSYYMSVMFVNQLIIARITDMTICRNYEVLENLNISGHGD